MDRRRFLQVTGAAALTAAGCSDEPPAATPADASPDLADDAPPPDAALSDAAPDAAPLDDAAPDVAPPDAAPDDVPVDAAPPEDAALDAPPDAPPDDAAPDAPAPDVRVDGGGEMTPVREDLASFPLGVASGEMSPEGAVLWTRFTASGSLALRVYDADERVVIDRAVTAADGGFVHAAVAGLRNATRYRYAFVRRIDGRDVARSSLGSFRTAPAEDAMDVVTFGGTSCTHQRARPFPTLTHAAGRSDLDFFVHGGDMAYCDGARSLADYRAKYAENLTSAGMRAVRASTGLYSTLDDHEVDNDFNPETVAAATLANARAAYFEHRPQVRNPATPDRVWRSVRWGRTLELFILDCRTERRPSTRTRSDAQYISRAQMDWLKAGLASSRAVFKLILNSVPITNFPLIWDVASGDRWEGYAAQRTEILDHIANRMVENVWWLSGDFHIGCVATLASSGRDARMREVLMGPGGNNANPLYASLLGRQWEFKTGESNYTVFRCDPRVREMTISFVNGSGREIFSRRYA